MASRAQYPAEMYMAALCTSVILLIKLGWEAWLKWSLCCFTCPFMSLKHIHSEHCLHFVPPCPSQMFLSAGGLLWEMEGPGGSSQCWCEREAGVARCCPFVRRQLASLTADLEPRHQKVNSQLLCACCCSASRGMGRDDPVVPAYPLESFLSILLAAPLYHIRSVWSEAQEPGSGTLPSIWRAAAIFSNRHMGIAA